VISLEAIPIPRVPRLPLVGDPLRRIRGPRDLHAVSTRADEATDLQALVREAAETFAACPTTKIMINWATRSGRQDRVFRARR
jgi:hypothetical protein